LAVKACPPGCALDLLWVALLHDIGKPDTTVKQDDDRITAHGHAKYGAELAERILERLDLPAERRRRIVCVIRHHMFHHSWQLKSPEELTNRQRTYLTDPDFTLLLEFLRIDTTASHGRDDSLQAYEV
jgi:putative nucleotidyltransferase with HDIG domain